MAQDDSEARSLGSLINVATRDIHTSLNRKILSLFPLALPPCSEDASLYAHGMSYILPIYETLTTSLQHIKEEEDDKTSTETPPQRIHAIYTLCLPIAKQSQRLSNDLAQLRPQSKTLAKTTNQLLRITNQISSTASKSPHLLLAHVHCFLLAIFSGGRYIRALLQEAGHIQPTFFSASSSQPTNGKAQQQDPDEYLTFWTFEPGTNDGEHIRSEFKHQFHIIASSLTAQEQGEIVSEAVLIMRMLEELVAEIAKLLA